MSPRTLASTAALAILVVLLLLAQAPAAAQTVSPVAKPAATNKAWTPPRTPDGKPDLQGIWTNSTLTPLERPKGLGAKEFYTDEEYAKLSTRVRERGEVGEEGDLGAARTNPLRYDLSLYGFDITKAKFASNKRTSLIVGPDGHIPAMLQEAKDRNAAILPITSIWIPRFHILVGRDKTMRSTTPRTRRARSNPGRPCWAMANRARRFVTTRSSLGSELAASAPSGPPLSCRYW